MTCNRIREAMCEYLDGELNSEATAVFEEHLSSCDVCRRETNELRDTLAWVKQACAVTPPPNLRKNIISILKKEKAAKRRFAPGFRQAVAAAAVFLFLIAGNLVPVQMARVADPESPSGEKAGIMRQAEAPATDTIEILTTDNRGLEETPTVFGETPPANEAYTPEIAGRAAAGTRDYTLFRIVFNLTVIPLLAYLLLQTFRKRREALQ